LIRNRTPSHFLRCCSAEQYAVIVASPTPAALAAKAATKTATRIAALVNPKNAETAEAVTKDVAAAGSASGAQIEVVYASDRLEIEAAFATFARNRVDALLVGTDPFFIAGASNLPRWQRAMLSPPYTLYASIRKPVV
jgi:ABC-type uncharacterized transport system substrate-binding protein